MPMRTPAKAQPAGSERRERLHPLHGSEKHPLPGSKIVRRVHHRKELSVTVILRRRRVRGQRSLQALSHRRPKRMGDREFIAKYGAEPEDIRRMRRFARGNHLAIEEINRARRSVILSGSAKYFESAFGVRLYHHSYPATIRKTAPPAGKEKHYRTFEGPVHVPMYLAGRVLGVFGLDNRRLSRPNVNS